ncbi:MAG: hypothetical protein ACRCUJ_07870 [Phocaeicola sp.]
MKSEDLIRIKKIEREMDRVSIALIFIISTLVLFTVIFCSCGSSSKATKADVEESVTDSSSGELKSLSGSKSSLSELSNISEAYDIDFKIYDTDKPIDPSTGKPPTLAEGTIKGTSNKESKIDINRTDSLSVSGSRIDTSSKEYKDKSETSAERKETSIPKQIGAACAGICLLYVVIWLLHKRFK